MSVPRSIALATAQNPERGLNALQCPAPNLPFVLEFSAFFSSATSICDETTQPRKAWSDFPCDQKGSVAILNIGGMHNRDDEMPQNICRTRIVMHDGR